MSVPGPRTFGARFRRLRKGYRLTLSEIVPESEAHSRVTHIELGHQLPSVEIRERLWSLLEQAIDRLPNERVDLDELSELRDRASWVDDEVAQACVRLRPGGLDCQQIASLMRISLRVVEQDLASALAKLRAAAAAEEREGGEGGEAQLMREWFEAVMAAREERDARHSLQEPDSDSWDLESETSGPAGYSRTREAHAWGASRGRVKQIKPRATSASESLSVHARTSDG